MSFEKPYENVELEQVGGWAEGGRESQAVSICSTEPNVGLDFMTLIS